MSRKTIAALVLGAAVLLVGFTSLYTVHEYDQVIITQFGKIQGEPVTNPGLHFKIPFAQTVHRFDNRWLEWDGDRNEIPTEDKKYIWIDTYARWRIKDPVLFYKRLRDEMSAQSRLDDIIDGEVRNVIATHELIDVVRSSDRKFELGNKAESLQVDMDDYMPEKGRSQLEKIVLQKASEVTPDYGIELADVRFKRVSYVESVQKKVFDRMISERQRIAQRYRSEGKGKAAEIRGQLEKELQKIESEAFEKAEEIRGDADGKAAAIYAEAHGKDPELYDLTKTLESYKSIIDENTDVVLSTDSDVLKLLRRQKP